MKYEDDLNDYDDLVAIRKAIVEGGTPIPLEEVVKRLGLPNLRLVRDDDAPTSPPA